MAAPGTGQQSLIHVANASFTRIALIIGALLLGVFPLVGTTFYVQLGAKIMILAIFAMSLDLLVGHTGLVSLGHAAYFGVAAYALALLSPRYEAASLWLTLPLAVAAAAATAFVIGFLVVRTAGVYFIMVTLAFAQMLYSVFHDTELGGGSDGIYIYVRPELSVAGIKPLDMENPVQFYYLVFVVMLAVYGLLTKALHAPFGKALQGIKANESRMRSIGYPVFWYKLGAFVLGGALAGLAGYLAACQFGFVNPEILAWHHSGMVLMMVILGGMGKLHGAVLGAFAYVLLQELFSASQLFGIYAKHWQLAMGSLIVLIVLALPHGLAGLMDSTAYVHKPGRTRAAKETSK
jgi:branched-chain amino acid transport system permease protein